MEIIKPLDISIEASLLSVMAIRANYDMYNSYIEYKKLLPDTTLILKDYKKYFDLYDTHERINWELFYTEFSQIWHQDFDIKKLQYYKEDLFRAISDYHTEDTEKCLLGLIQKHTKEELLNGSFKLEKLRSILDNYETLENKIIRTSDKEVATIANVDFNVLDKSEGIPWALPSLQKSLGSLVKGQLVIISADFGTGKSAFVISQAAAALNYLTKTNKGCILYFNSEGTEADVFGRLCSNLFKDNFISGFEQIVDNREIIREQFLKLYKDNRFLVSQITNNSVDWLYNKLQKYNPALVIIDITDTLAKEENVISLKKVFDRLRVISGSICPIIATTQAGDQSYRDSETGEQRERKWLGDKALYGAKVGKGGAADTIITIGKDEKQPTLRYVSVVKKKRGKAVNITCELKEEYSLYEELAW